MKNFKKMLSVFLALAMVLSIAAMMAGCNNTGDGNDSTDPTGGSSTGETGTYVINVKTMGGMAMSGLDVYVYADDTLGDLKQFGQTKEDGSVSFTLPKSDDYAIVISGAPKGYDVKASYAFTGNAANIVLNSALVTGDSLANASLGLGDVMYDFSVQTPDGQVLQLSKILEEKKMALLNFWYTGCSWCVTEFPYMDEAYQMYQDKAAVIALDPMPTDNDMSIKGFWADMGLSFPAAMCDASWANTFGISGYPTTVVVDRYGVICMVHAGAITSRRPFVSIFEHFTAADYKQKLIENPEDLVIEVTPTQTMASSEEIGALINNGDIKVTYRPETEGENAKYIWPFVATEKNGEKCLMASNKGIEASYAIMYADVELKAGQAVGFDYLISSRKSQDVMYVIVNDEPIYQISGVSDPEEWKSCYPWVAAEDGTYEIALCFQRDEGDGEGDDTVYIKNMRVMDAGKVDAETFIPRYAASTKDGFTYNYVDIVLNEKDGYYHVGSANGPLLLANLLSTSDFNEENSVYLMSLADEFVLDGYNYREDLVDYASFASNSAMNGYCTVDAGLAEVLKKIDQIAGFDDADPNEWLKLCKYYEVYGSEDAHMEDPIKGLAPHSAYEAKLGKNVESNYFYYDRAIIPRGLLAEFIPTRSGVYRITSRNESTQGVDAWIFDENRNELLVYEQDERMFNDSDEVSMLYYMEAGKPYYIDIAFWDMYEIGYIYYDIEYVAYEYELFRACSPGYFTYDTNATGDAMYHVIAGGIKPILKDDGYYYEDLGKDANGNQRYGSLIYVDFTGLNAIFSHPISTVNSYDENGNIVKDANGNPVMIKGQIDMGGFDFTKTTEDQEILTYLANNNNDVEATKQYLKNYWGDTYDSYAEIYQLEDIFAGRYHGTGEDLTEEARAYVSKIITSGPEERRGCVAVDERLAEMLQMLMDKYTFQDVDHSWTKLCYYYDYLGPDA